MPIVSGGGGGGGPAAGSYWPVGNKTGVTVDSTTYSDTIKGGGAKLTTLVFPGDQSAFGLAIAGDAHPRMIVGSDATDTGISFSDGTTDPSGSTGVYLTGAGTLGLNNYGGVQSVFGRLGAVAAANGDYAGVVAAHLTGATAATRYVGGTTLGAPVAGTFAVGDFVIDQAAHLYVCTVAGTPGTWVGVPPTAGGGYSGNAVNVTNGTTGSGGNLGFDTLVSGSAQLNISVPKVPTIVTAGTYAVTVNILVGADMTAAGSYVALLQLLNSTLAIATSAPSSTSQLRPRVSLCTVGYIAAGDSLNVNIENRDGASTRAFSIDSAYVQRLA